jgi:hypothetical protein
MNGDPADNALIERFLLNKLSSDEVIDFNLRLDDDREFARKYRLMSMFPEMMSETGRKELQQKQSEAETIIPPKKSFKIPNKKTFWIAGATIAVVCISVSALIFTVNNQANNDKLVAEDEEKSSATVPAAEASMVTLKNDPVPEPEKISPKEKAISSALIAPENGKIIPRTETIVFHWEIKTDTFTRICIEAEPTKRMILWRGIKPGVQNFEIPGLYLKPGQYSWYIGADNSTRNSFFISENIN